MDQQREIKEFPAMVGEDFDDYIYTLKMFRKSGIEVIGVYNGIKFNIMDGEDIEDAYDKAYKSSIAERQVSQQKRNEDLQEVTIEQVKLFIAANKGNDHLTTGEIMEFLNQIARMQYMFRELRIPQDLVNEVIDILRNVGYEPIEPENAYLTTSEDKEGYKDWLVWETFIKFPSDSTIDKEPESVSTVAIRNAMLQLQNDGNVDWRTSEFYMLYNELKGKVLKDFGF